MNMTTLPTSLITRGLAAAALLVFVAGCTTVYVPRYADQGVYYDEPYSDGYSSHPAASSSYGYDRAWAVNPVHYPYWSLDYFYFSQFYHPYSVVVGSWDPYYYPYPGWRYAPRHHYRGGFGISIAIGDPWYGYPWHGYGWGYRPVHYGYFGSAWYSRGYRHGYGHGYGHGYSDRHPVHRNNDRMRALQRRESAATRNVLISQRNGRLNGARYVPDRGFQGRANQPHKRGEIRREAIGSRTRATGPSRLDRRASAPVRGATTSRAATRSRLQSRPSVAPRSESRRVEPLRRGTVREAPRVRISPAPRRVEPRAAPRRESFDASPRRSGARASSAPREVIQSRSIRRDAPRVRRAPSAAPSSRAPRTLRAAPARARSEAPRSSRPRASAPRPAVRSASPRPAPRAESRAPSRSPARAQPRSSSGGRDRLRSRRGSGRGNR